MNQHSTLLGSVFSGILGLASLAVTQAAPFDQAHPLLDKTLKTYVKDALVDYAAWKTNRQDLDRYLRGHGVHGPCAWPRGSRGSP